MTSTKEIAKEISVLMPIIARKILFEFFHEVDISQTQILTLMAVYELEQCRLSNLTEVLHIAPPTTSGIVDRLVKAGFVDRKPDDEDRRAVKISLSKKGEKIAIKMRATIADRWKDVLGNLPKDDQMKFIEILRKITQTIS